MRHAWRRPNGHTPAHGTRLCRQDSPSTPALGWRSRTCVLLDSATVLGRSTVTRTPSGSRHPSAGVDGESCLQSLVPWAGVWPFGRRQACRMKTAQRGKRRYCVKYKQNLAHAHVVAAVKPQHLQPRHTVADVCETLAGELLHASEV